MNPLDEPAWDQLVAAHPAANCFHTAGWARVLSETYHHRPAYFVRRWRDGLEHVLPVMEVRSPWTGRRGVSLPFTDECSVLGSPSPHVADLYAAALEFGRTRNWKYLEVRGDIARWPGATPALAYFRHQLDLGRAETDLFAGFESAVRRAIRKAESAGVRVESSQSLDAMRTYFRLHCLTRRRHGLPPQPWRFFENLARHLIAKGQGCVFIARMEQRSIAAAIFLHHGRRATYKFGASDYAHQELRANQLLMWRAIQSFANAGCVTLDFGRTSANQEGLRRFKRSFGAAEDELSYARFDYRSNRFVTASDRAHGPINRVFRRLPLPLLRWAGATLYPHLS